MSRSPKRTTRGDQEGFTLIELLLALALISTTFLTLLYLRGEAEMRSIGYVFDRRIQKLAQQKLDEVVYGVEEDRNGTLIGPPEITWQATIEDVSESESIFLECVIEMSWVDVQQEDQNYTLTSWFLPDANDPILQGVDLINTSTDDDATGGR